jgi:type I restriction enzyme S subunit
MISDKIIRFHPLPLLDARYLALTLNAGDAAQELESIKSGMAVMQMNISQQRLQTISLPIPPLAEQHRIVAKVDELMAVCNELEAVLASAQAARGRLLESLLHGALDVARIPDRTQTE